MTQKLVCRGVSQRDETESERIPSGEYLITKWSVGDATRESGLQRYNELFRRDSSFSDVNTCCLRVWRDAGDKSAGDHLLTSHLRLAAKIAIG